MVNDKLGFIGFGFMGKNLLSGFLKASVIKPQNAICYDIFTEGLKNDLATTKFKDVKMADSIKQVIDESDIIFLAVKPDTIESVLKGIDWENIQSKIIVSIAAGITLNQIELAIGKKNLVLSKPEFKHKIFRVMPNQCISIGAGVCALSRGSNVTDNDEKMIEQLLNSVGLCKIVPEKYIDIVTAVSGSGPAYMFMMLDALGTAGAMHGLTKSDALELAPYKMMGSAKMYLESKIHPCQLIDSVCSPGGTTLRGVAQLKENNFEHAIISAVNSAYERARELRN